MPAKILLIEDDLAIQGLIAHLLRACGHTVTTAEDGPEALELAAAEKPDVILCDINLPTTNGLDVLKGLRTIAAVSATPVIAITASGTRSKEAEARVAARITGLGFAAYIPKPIDLKTFADQVECFLPAALGG